MRDFSRWFVLLSMKDLPYEIITNILLCLSPRYIAQCSLINKTFYTLTRDPIFYLSVELYTHEQLEKFISMAKITTTHGKPIGHWVQQLKIKELQGKRIDMKYNIELRRTCPNAFFIGYKRLPNVPLLDYLQLTNDDDGNTDKLWDDLVYLQLDVVSEIKSNKGILKLEADQEQQQLQRKRNMINAFYTRTEEHSLISKNGYHPFYHGKVMLFSLSSPSSTFHHLKELHLQFHSFDQQYLLPEMYELDERTINAILLSCPHIEVLKLIRFFMNHRHQYNLNNITIASPCNTLKTLYLDDCIITEPENFCYFSFKFPRLSTLHINLNTHFEFKINDKLKFTLAIQEMVASFIHLNHLIYSSSICLNIGAQLLAWLTTNPNKLKTFNLKSDDICLDSINNNNNDHENTTNIKTNVTESVINSIMNVEPIEQQQHNYIYDRIERRLSIYDNPAVYDYILNYKHNDIIPLSLTSLDINTYLATDSSFTFDKWLKILPNLKELCLRGMDIDVTTTTTGKGNNNGGLFFFQLRHLTFYECDFYSSNNISVICQMCPLLRSLELNTTTIYNMVQELLPTSPVLFTLEFSQLVFEKLIIDKFYYFFQHPGSYYTAKKLTINELKLNNTFTTGPEYDDDYTVHVVVNCQSADVVLFDYE
ncbi:unnamed protein product [Cunninghamella echinulata]